jgi:hypothetical protein
LGDFDRRHSFALAPDLKVIHAILRLVVVVYDFEVVERRLNTSPGCLLFRPNTRHSGSIAHTAGQPERVLGHPD